MAQPVAVHRPYLLPLLLFFALNLRTVLLSVSPLLPLIQHDLGLNYTATGLLSNLPILLMGGLAYPASLVIARIGPRRAVAIALGIMVSMGIVRGLAVNTWQLFLATALLSLGVTLGQTTSPTLVRAWFPRHIGQTTAAYSIGLMSGEIVGASGTVPWILPLVGGNWRGALLFWAIPAALALGCWLLTARQRINATADATGPASPEAPVPIPWRTVIIAALGLGSASVMFFGMSTWIPVYFHTLGRDDTPAALASLTISQLPPSLALSLWRRRFISMRMGFLLGGVVAATTFALWLVAPASWDVALAGLVGASSAAIFIFGLSVPSLIGHGPAIARISGVMLTISYTLAFAIPALGGILWDHTGMPQSTFIPLLGAALVTIAAGIFMPPIAARG